MGYVALAWKTDQLEAIRSDLRNDTLMGQLSSTIALVLIMLFAIRAMLGRPLNAINQRIEQLSAGDLNSDVAHQDRRDEIGVIARALEGFRTATLDKEASEEQVEIERREQRLRREEPVSDRGNLPDVFNRLHGFVPLAPPMPTLTRNGGRCRSHHPSH
jgi:methyl-accepting chemotaxis protein